MNTTALYALRAGKDGPIKIGSSESVDTRISNLQSGHYQELGLVASAPGSGELERPIHWLLQSLRIRGEWYDIADDLCQRMFLSLDDAAFVDSLTAFSELSHEMRVRMAEEMTSVGLLELALSGCLVETIERFKIRAIRRSGRPAIPDDLKRRRPKRLVIMLWDDEHGAISKRAGGVNVSTWAREVLLREAAK